MQYTAEDTHLARGFSCNGHEGAALVLCEIAAAAFGVIKLHACLRSTDTVHMNSVSRRATTKPDRKRIIPCSRGFPLYLRCHPDTELAILYRSSLDSTLSGK